ncbi:DUF2007 domain-containing protein [Vibrio zhugei]|uniref:DUF2007 domain-containing protein n=1 Tax=Vibrio zhugei TaxID=2479546 RepID=A0ABV7C6A6_9VIBR|nr:DUF2007 domain-containing protein [Vibrio zhugei]
MKIYLANNPTEAHIICGLLQSENIACEVRGEQWFSLLGEIPMDENSMPYIWLFHAFQADEAHTIIRKFQKESTDTVFPNWTCRQCHEVNEGQFAICWHCGCALAEYA